MLFNKLLDYYHTRVNYFDILKSKNKYDKNKINIGWCSVFPPTKNGTAAASFYIVKKLREREDINLFLIPFEGNFEGKKYPARIDKRLFRGCNITTIDNEKLDIIVLFLLGDICGEAAGKTKAPFIIWQTIHDPINEESENILFSEIKKLNYKKTFLTSQAAADEYAKAGAKQVYYLPLGVDKNIFKPQDNASENFTVLFLSRIAKYKGIIPFLESIPLTLSKCADVKFKIHAPFDGVLKIDADLRKIIDSIKKDYPDNFSFDLKWTSYENLNNIYKGINLLVFPSNNEGFGVPLIEAMACGIPSIVLNKPPMNEIIKDGYTGFCLELNEAVKDKYKSLTEKDKYHYKEYENWAFPSPEDMADKIIYLYQNENIHKTFSDNCISCSENFELKKLADKFIEIIKPARLS